MPLKARLLVRSIAVALVIGGFVAEGALVQTARLLPVSDGELKLGEWNSNFSGALAVADAHAVPLLVFFGGLSCGRCENLQKACLTDECVAGAPQDVDGVRNKQFTRERVRFRKTAELHGLSVHCRLLEPIRNAPTERQRSIQGVQWAQWRDACGR